MGSIAYHLNTPNIEIGITNKKSDNRTSTEISLLANCAGIVSTPVNHTNRNIRRDYYLIYVISGKLKLRHDNEFTSASVGDVVIFPPNKEYEFKIFGVGEKNYFWVHFTGIDVEKKLSLYNLDTFPAIHKTNTINNINETFKRLFKGFSKNDRFKRHDLSSLLDKLLIEVGRSIEAHETDRIFLSNSIRYLNEHYTDQIRIPELAKMEGMCMTLYNKLFKRQMGVAPTKYIMNLRIQHAIELLDTSDIPINEIGTICGYNNFNFFSRIFKSCVGKSPSEYRKQSH